MRGARALRTAGLAAAACALLAAAPAPKPPSPLPYGPAPLSTVKPPSDPAQYDLALDRLRKMPPEEAFGFAAFDHQLPVENLGRQTQPGSIRIASLTLKVRPEVVYENYRVGLSQKYLPLLQGRTGPHSAYVSFRDPQDGFMRTVTVAGEGNSALVVVAISDPERLLHRPAASTEHAPASWPMPPALGEATDMETDEMGTLQRTRVVSVACADSADPLTFFDTHLPEKGWLPEKQTRSVTRESSHQQYRRGEEVCRAVTTFKAGQPCGLSVICTSRK